MATRMQQRRGTAAQWTSANPILNAGEMGWESDTNKFKIGDGTNHWADLDYFIDQSSTVNPAFGSSIVFEGSTADAYETTLQVTDPTADRTITLPNSSGTVVLADGSGNVTVSGNLTVQGTTTTVDSTTINVVNSFTFEGSTADSYETTLTVTDPTADRTITLPNVSGTVITTGNLNATGATAAELGYLSGVTSAIQTQLDGKTATGHAHTISDITFIEATAAEINKLAGLATTETELSYVAGVTSGIQAQLDGKAGTGHTHLLAAGATDVTASASELNIMDGVTASTAEINILDGLTASTAELNYVDGVTSAIQTQLNGKSDTGHTHGLSAITDVTASAAEVNILDGVTASTAELNILDGVTASAAELNILDGATLSTTELNYVDGVTSAIQTQLDNKLALAGGTMTGAIAMGTNKITGLGDPTADQDAATKAYVDAATAGLNVHEAVRAATTGSKVLSSDFENGDILDGVTLATGNRILVKDQSTKSENGIYVVAASGAPTRATDYNTSGEVDAGDFIFVQEGTVNGKTGWVQTNVVATVGTNDIEFTQFSGAGTYSAGTGLTLSGTEFSINTATTADLSTAQTLTNKTINGANNTLTVRLANDVSGTLPVANGGTGVTTSTGTGSVVLSTSPTLTTPTIGAATATSIAFSDGTQSKEGVPSRTPIIQKTDSYTLSALSERDSLIEMGKATAQTLTVPTNATVAWPVGTSISILQTGAGQVTVAGAGGVTINATPGLKLRAQWSSATLLKRATDTWVLFGDLSA